MAIKPDFHILAKDCEDGNLDWKYHIYKSEKDAREFADKLDGEWRIFKLEPVEVIDERYDIYYIDGRPILSTRKQRNRYIKN